MELLLSLLFVLLVDARLSSFIDYVLTLGHVDIPDRIMTKAAWIIFYVGIVIAIAVVKLLPLLKSKSLQKSINVDFIKKYYIQNKILLNIGGMIVLSSIISAVFSLDKSQALFGVFYYIVLFSIMLLVKEVWSKKLSSYFYYTQIITAVILFAVSVLQIIAFQHGGQGNLVIKFFDNYGGFMPISFFVNDAQFGGMIRPSSLIVDPNFTAVFGVTQLFFGLRYLKEHYLINKKVEKLFSKELILDIVLLVVTFGYVLFASSRTSVLMFGFGIAFYLFYVLLRKYKVFEKFKKPSISLGSFFLGDYIKPLYTRILETFSLSDSSSQSHLDFAKIAIDAFLSSPIVGIGIGCYATYYMIHIDPNAGTTNSHSAYFRILSELGVVGVFVWSVFIIYFVRQIWIKKSIFYMVFFLSILLANVTYDFMMTPWLWFYFGYILGELQISKMQKS